MLEQTLIRVEQGDLAGRYQSITHVITTVGEMHVGVECRERRRLQLIEVSFFLTAAVRGLHAAPVCV